MSEHVKRAGRDYTVFYILLIGLLLILVGKFFDFYKLPRTAYVETTPKAARIYSGDILICEATPCEISLRFWPETVWIRRDNYYDKQLPVFNPDHFMAKHQTYSIPLRPKPIPKKVMPKTYEGKGLPQAPKDKGLTERPKPKPSPPRRVSAPNLPLECQETYWERAVGKNRDPVLCHFEDDKDVLSLASGRSGECYATFFVLQTGYVRNIHSYGCQHEDLIEPAKRAFKNRLYLPALIKGTAVNKVIKAEIVYGSDGGDLPQNPAIKYKRELEHRTLDNNVLEGQTSKKTINKDAQIISCPRFKTPSSLKRSGHCIFEFDLTDKGRISQMRQIKCTDSALKAVTLSSLKKCKFSPAVTDGVAVNRVYMKHQIDANVYNRNGQKIPVHSSFGTNSLEKPYKIYK